MRVNKYISEAGLCSRREADEWLLAGRVTINGEVVTTGAKALEGDEVRVDGPLEPEVTTGHLVVSAPAGAKVEVLVDGTDVGATPWEGDVKPGLGFRRVDPADQQWRYRQLNPARGKPPRKGVPGRGEQAGDR